MSPQEHRHLMQRIDSLAKKNRELVRENNRLQKKMEKIESAAKKLLGVLG